MRRARELPVLTCLLAAVALTLTVAMPAAQGHPSGPSEPAPQSWGCTSDDLDLDGDVVEFAPISPAETTPDGKPLQYVSGPDDLWVPVVFVPGWASRSTHPNDGDERHPGTFSHLVDLSARSPWSVDVTRSLIGQIQDLPGAAVFTFDYHKYSARWVTDERLGPNLGKVIDCLHEKSGQKVIIVGHSMGGLVARQALSEGGREAKVSRVITLGTPHSGSIAAMLLGGAVDGALAVQQATVLRLLLSACTDQMTENSEMGGICRNMPLIDAFTGEAGRALRTGSGELAALPDFPPGVKVTALAGDTQWAVPRVGWFASPWETTDVSLGDLVVTRSSAQPPGAATYGIDCHYQLNVVRGATDTTLQIVNLRATDEVAQSPLEVSGACFHANLMRSTELTNQVLGAVQDDIAEQLPHVMSDEELLNATIPAGACYDGEMGWPSQLDVQLRNGTGWSGSVDEYNVNYIIETQILGRADVNGDGRNEVVISFICAGAEPDACCAGQSGKMASINVFQQEGGKLNRFAVPYMGGDTLPGNEYGPISRTILQSTLEGTTLVTQELNLYAFQYNYKQASGDPYRKITSRLGLRGDKWEEITE